MTSKIEKKCGFGTRAVHAGQSVDSDTGSRAQPIYQTSSYTFKSMEHAAELFALNEPGWIYTRLQNPTTAVLEDRVTALEGGVAGLVLSSGMQAITVALLNLVRKGDHIVSAGALYGGTVTLLSQTLPRYGVETTFVDMTDAANIEPAIRPNTKVIYCESLANPKNDVLEYEKIAEIAHRHNIPLIMDNTVLSPYLFNPFDYGCDIVIHSLTKYIGGHGSSLGGAIVDSGNFDWTKEPDKWPQFTRPDPSYHGIVFQEKFGKSAYIVTCRVCGLRDFGGCISPLNSFLLLQGAETLHLRMPRHSQNAQELAEYLELHPKVESVNYPGLASHPGHQRALKYFPKGMSGVLGFNIKGGRDAGKRFVENVQLASHLVNIGDTRTLVAHPGSTTHAQLSDSELTAAGIGPSFIRVSVGIEDVDDIIADFANALASV